MRLVKMLGLAMVAALATMAFIGASSASAVTLCEELTAEEGGAECPAAKRFAVPTTLHAELAAGTKAVLEGGGLFGNIECEESASEGNTVAEGSTELSLMGEITKLTFGKCTHGAETCTVESEHKPYLVLVLLTGEPAPAPKWHVVVEKKGTNGRPQAKVTCPAGSCTFGKEEVLFGLLPLGTPPVDVHLSVAQELEREGGVFCPAKSTWKATYLVKCLKPALTRVGCFPAMKP